MTTFHLDTNTVIALTKSNPVVLSRLSAALASGSTVSISSVVWFELWFGVFKSAQHQRNAANLAKFAAGQIAILPFDAAEAKEAGEIRAALNAIGRPIGSYDLLIAGHARLHGATVVTNNTGEFARVAKLALDDWTK